MIQYPFLSLFVEANQPIDPKAEDKIAGLLHDKRFAKAVRLALKGKVLVRNVKQPNLPYYFRKAHKKTRRAKDSDSEVDNWVENFRASNFPKAASRKRGMFCFPKNILRTKKISRRNKTYGHSYGQYAYLVFPQNRDKVFQSDDEGDFYKSPPYDKVNEFIHGGSSDYAVEQAEESFDGSHYYEEYLDEAKSNFEDQNDVSDYEEEAGNSIPGQVNTRMLEDAQEEANLMFRLYWKKEKKRKLQSDMFLSPEEVMENAKKKFVSKMMQRIYRQKKREYAEEQAQELYDEAQDEYAEEMAQNLYDDAKQVYVQDYLDENEGNEDDAETAMSEYFRDSKTTLETLNYTSRNEAIVETKSGYLAVNIQFLIDGSKSRNLKSMVDYLWYLVRKL